MKILNKIVTYYSYDAKPFLVNRPLIMEWLGEQVHEFTESVSR